MLFLRRGCRRNYPVFRCKFCWRLIVQRTVRLALVVVLMPSDNRDTSFAPRRKPLVIKALFPETSVKAFDESVLWGLAGLNHCGLNAALVGRLVERLPGEL